MAKIVKFNEDRLSHLPDALLHHIFSFLLTKNVVQTCLLSKRYTDLWRSFPFLHLSSEGIEHVDFIKFTQSLLRYRDRSYNVDSFRVRCIADVDNINSWIVAVSKRNVRLLDIEFSVSVCDPNMLLEFTPRLFACASLTVLKLNFNWQMKNVILPTYISLPCLKLIHFAHIMFEDDQLSRMISASPLLQSLVMQSCIVDLLDISCPQLEMLSLGGYVSIIDISAPRLTCFEIFETEADPNESNTVIRSIGDFPELLGAKIDIISCSQESFMKLIVAVRKAQSLKFSTDVLYKFGCVVKDDQLGKWIQSPFDNIKYLKLETCFDNKEILAIYELLKLSPNIETFFLRHEFNESGSETPTDISACSEFKLPCLKLVIFKHPGGEEDEIKLVEFLLENAVNLEKLNITALDELECEELYPKMGKLLLTSPRCGKLSLDNSGTGVRKFSSSGRRFSLSFNFAL